MSQKTRFARSTPVRVSKFTPTPSPLRNQLRVMDYHSVLKTEQAKEFRQNVSIGENNWKSRMQFCSAFSDVIEKRGKDDVPHNYVEQVEPFLNNALDCAISERTTLSMQGCRLLGNLPKILGRDIHPHLDRILPVIIKLCASTKNVAAKAAAAVVLNFITYSTYHPRLLWHVCQTFEEKNTGPRSFAPGWLRQILKDYYKSIHPDRDYESIKKAISIGLEDANPGVRTENRGVFWTYYRIDPEGAQGIMERLNNHARIALENDPNNPEKKQTAAKAKAPARPESALSQMRKQKLQERAAQKSQQSSTPDEHAIEIHEPRATKVDRREKPLPPPPPPAEIEKSHISKTASRPNTHKKSPSQELEPAPKSTAGSRGLMSAPVRRPRIVATPINAPVPSQSSQNSRPSSRTGHAKPLPREPPQSSSRPTSSSSAKPSASMSSSLNSPKLKPTPASPPRSKAVHVPDGKENATLYSSTKSKPSPTLHRPVHHSPPKRPQSATPKLAAQQDSAFQPLMLDSDTTPKPTVARPPVPRLLPSSSEPPFVPTRGHIKSNSADYDLSSARRYVEVALKHLHQGSMDPLGYRKLKNIIEQHSQTLFVERIKYDELFGELLARLHGLDENETKDDAKPYAKHPTYNRQLILQMIVPLLLNFPQWSYKWLTPTLSAVILYRCTLPIDGTDRRSLAAVQVIDAIVRVAPDPLELIDSVTAALQIGEEAIVSYTSSDVSLGSYNPTSITGSDGNPDDSGIGTQMTSEASVAQMRRYMQTALKHNSVDLPKKLPLLVEFGLNTLIAILERARTERPSSPVKGDAHLQSSARKFRLSSQQADDLGLLAAHCMRSFDYVIKRAVVPYCQALYQMMGKNDEAFFKYFQDESEVNLLEYYLAGVRA